MSKQSYFILVMFLTSMVVSQQFIIAKYGDLVDDYDRQLDILMQWHIEKRKAK